MGGRWAVERGGVWQAPAVCPWVTSALFLVITEMDGLYIGPKALFELTEKLAPHCRPKHGADSLGRESKLKLGVVVYKLNLSTWEAEAGLRPAWSALQVLEQPGLQDRPCLTKIRTKPLPLSTKELLTA